MTKEEVMKLHEELNELSAFEEWNLERMVEIAKILKDFYMPNKNKNGWNGTLHKLWQADWEEMTEDSVH